MWCQVQRDEEVFSFHLFFSGRFTSNSRQPVQREGDGEQWEGGGGWSDRPNGKKKEKRTERILPDDKQIWATLPQDHRTTPQQHGDGEGGGHQAGWGGVGWVWGGV